MSTAIPRVRKVNLTSLVKPGYITLTGLPANQTGFKILRDDTDPKESSMTTRKTTASRVRRSESVLAITFEVGLEEESIDELLESYGLSGYSLSQQADGSFIAFRSDVTALPTDATAINLGGGRTAYIPQIAVAQRSEGTADAIAVTSLVFRIDAFPEEADVRAWIASKSVDISDTVFNTSDSCITVSRTATSAVADSRQMELESGVVAVVTRAEVQEVTLVPAPYVEVVSETAYGSWGWGQLDFAASLADEEFCDALDEARYAFSRVVERIMYYSSLPLATRKDLVNRATSQYGAYLCTLMDALPTKLVMALRNDKQSHKESTMSQKTGDTAAPAAAAPAAPAAAAPEAAATPASITREDIVSVVNEMLTPISKQISEIAAALPASTAARSDTPATASAAPAETVSALEAIVRSVKDIGETVSKVGERVGALEGITAVRSDSGDGAQTTQRKDVFAGLLNGARPAKPE